MTSHLAESSVHVHLGIKKYKNMSYWFVTLYNKLWALKIPSEGHYVLMFYIYFDCCTNGFVSGNIPQTLCFLFVTRRKGELLSQHMKPHSKNSFCFPISQNWISAQEKVIFFADVERLGICRWHKSNSICRWNKSNIYLFIFPKADICFEG